MQYVSLVGTIAVVPVSYTHLDVYKRQYVKYLMVAAFAGGFLFTYCRTARETTAQYEVCLLYTSERLFVSFHCHFPGVVLAFCS